MTTNLEALLTSLLEKKQEHLICSLLIRNSISIEFSKVYDEDISEGVAYHDKIIQFLSINRPDLIGQTFELSTSIVFWENINDDGFHETPQVRQ